MLKVSQKSAICKIESLSSGGFHVDLNRHLKDVNQFSIFRHRWLRQRLARFWPTGWFQIPHPPTLASSAYHSTDPTLQSSPNIGIGILWGGAPMV